MIIRHSKCLLCIFLVLFVLLTCSVVDALTMPSPKKQHPPPSNNKQPPAATGFRLGYVTDVEGNLDYFLRWVHQSNVLTTAPGTTADSKCIALDLTADSYFVFGGDAVDKGPGDIRLLTALVNLKRRHPDRVTLLVGNRDLNKLRLTAELSATDLSRPIDEIPPPHWDPTAPTLRQFLEKKQKEMEQDDASTAPSLDELNTRVNRLHYLLQHTLGCPHTFEFRRHELALLQDCAVSDIDDEQVVDNFLYHVQHGALFGYLNHADVAVCVGNTLFCHGAVDAATMQFVPCAATKFENPVSAPPAAAMIQKCTSMDGSLEYVLKTRLARLSHTTVLECRSHHARGRSAHGAAKSTRHVGTVHCQQLLW